MVKLLLARQFAGKKIITNDGNDLGRLTDLIINEKNGSIETLIVEPNLDNVITRRLKKEEGDLYVSYSAVLAVSDYIIVDRKSLGI